MAPHFRLTPFFTIRQLLYYKDMADFILPRYTYPRITPNGEKIEVLYSNEMQLILWEAEQLGMSWSSIPDLDMIKLMYKNHVEFMRKGPTLNHVPGPTLCSNKAMTRAVLQYADLPVVRGFSILKSDSDDYIQQVFDSLQKPLVVKPSTGTHGSGINMNINTVEELQEWINHLLGNTELDNHSDAISVVVEEMAKGEEYRIIATRDKVLAVMNRQPASVIGDGNRSIKQLIDIKNTDPMRNMSQTGLYPHITPDEDMIRILQKSQCTLETVPKKDEKVVLREVSNVMAGGDAFDVTDEIHPTVAEIAFKTIKAIPGMSLIGIDFMTTDITKDQSTQLHAIIEVNSAPEFDMHDIPMHGKKRNVAKAIVLMMFPELVG